MTNLKESDWTAAFTKDPDAFITAVVLSSLFADKAHPEGFLERQKLVFRKWLGFYSADFRETIASSVQATYDHRFEQAIKDAQVDVLATLPMKKYLGKTIVDMDEVKKKLDKLITKEL